MILTRDAPILFSAAAFSSPCGTHKHQSQAGGRGRGGSPTSLNNKLVVLHVDVAGTDLKMKLWSSCSRWGRLAFKPARLRLQLGSRPRRHLSK